MRIETKGEIMSNLKQQRYEELRRITDADDWEHDDEVYAEQCQLFYELNPHEWRPSNPSLTPRDVWGVDTSCYED